MRSTHCRSNTYDPGLFSVADAHTRVPGPVPGLTACMLRGAPAMQPGRSSHTQVAGFPMPAHNWIPGILTHVWDWRATVSTSERRTSPQSHWKGEWGVTTVWYTSAPNRKICKDLIRRKSGNCSYQHEFFFLSPSWTRTEILAFTLSAYLFLSQIQSCLFSKRVFWWISNVIKLSRWSTWCFHSLLISILMATHRDNR